MYKIFTTENLDPWYNLSIENWLLTNNDFNNCKLLFLWRNRSSVILGRFQNPWLECNVNLMHENRIDLLRRQSGGGAVFHDEGNSNFSFISEKTNCDKNEITKTVIQSLRELKINAQMGDRNDIYVKGRKISGSASKYTSTKVLHHGTLLIDVNLEELYKYLKMDIQNKSPIISKGIESIRSKVINLREINKEITHQSFCDSLCNILEETEEIEINHISQDFLDKNEVINDYYKSIKSRDWIFGNTPTFQLARSIDVMGLDRECSFTIKKGIITDMIINIPLDSNIDSIKESYLDCPCEILFDQ